MLPRAITLGTPKTSSHTRFVTFLIFLDKSSEVLAQLLKGNLLKRTGKFFENLRQRFQLPVFVEPSR
jgi:hypothetical protein